MIVVSSLTSISTEAVAAGWRYVYGAEIHAKDYYDYENLARSHYGSNIGIQEGRCCAGTIHIGARPMVSG